MALLTLHFASEELKCPCCGRCEMDPIFLQALERLRVEIGSPLVVNSGFRCPAHNAAVGGAPHSFHVRGMAADLRVETDEKRLELIRAAVRVGFNGLGVAASYLHVDTRPESPVCWTYAHPAE